MALVETWLRCYLAMGLLVVLSMPAGAKEIEKVQFANQIELGDKKLKLNGVGLRSKRKLGIDFRVYVAGLYLITPNQKAGEILHQDEPKRLELEFLRSVGREALREAWEESYNKNCGSTCASTQNQLKKLNAEMIDMPDHGKMHFTFSNKGVELELEGKEKRTVSVTGSEFSQNLLAVFIGEHPASEPLKRGLLGLE